VSSTKTASGRRLLRRPGSCGAQRSQRRLVALVLRNRLGNVDGITRRMGQLAITSVGAARVMAIKLLSLAR
jgi:hypothetical protein